MGPVDVQRLTHKKEQHAGLLISEPICTLVNVIRHLM